MIVGLATFEHLPKRVGGLAEAATSIGESLARTDDVMVFMPSHGIHKTEKDLEVKKYGKFAITSRTGSSDVTVYEMVRNGVRMFLMSDEIMDHPDVYSPREMLSAKITHFARAFPAAINLILARENKKPDVVHVNDWHCSLAGAAAKKYFGIPMVYTIHRICREKIRVSDMEEAGLHEFLDPECVEKDRGIDVFNLETYGCRQCDHLTTVSYTYLNEEWDSLFGAYSGKVTYVWNGMDSTFWDPGKLKNAGLDRSERRAALLRENGLDDGIMYFYVGRFDMEQKGVDHLFSAANLILSGKVAGSDRVAPHMRLVVLGSGDPALEKMAHEMESRYPKNVKVIIGYLSRETTREYYGASDFTMVTSNFEPFGLVQLEAMCMGSIPIGTAVGGIKDTVIDVDESKDRATGKLVRPRDPQAIAGAMVRMGRIALDDQPRLEQIRANGRPHVVTEFTWEKAADRYRAVYQGRATMKLPFADFGGPF